MKRLVWLFVLGAAACGGDDAPDCTPVTCASLSSSCGSFPDGCGGTLTCGACSGGQVCGGGGVPGVCATRICTAPGWCWQNPMPQGNPLFSVWGRASDDVWAVGPLGTIMHFDGARWSPSTHVGTELIQDVWGAAANDAWAVALEGVILHYDGRDWSRVESPTQKGLLSIFGFSANDIWAVGTEGTILRYRGERWETLASGVPNTLYSVWGAAPNDGWIVGGGVGLHWDGMAVAPSSISENDLLSVFGHGAGDIWSAGRDGELHHFTGSGWTRVHSGVFVTLFAIWGPSASEMYAVGPGGLLLSYNGQGWLPRRLGLDPFGNFSGETLQDLWGFGDDGWIIGSRGSLYRRKGDWRRVESDRPRELRGIWAASQSAAFAVGSEGSFLRWDGTSWERGNAGNETRNARAVWGAAPNDVWAVGENGLMLRHDGTSYRVFGAGTQLGLHGISGSSTNDIWAVGEGGVITHWAGPQAGWATIVSPTQTTLQAVHLRAANDGWAVGDGGTILRYDGQWRVFESPVTGTLRGVFAVSAGEAFAVGDGGTVLRFTGGAWAPEESKITDDLYGVWGTSPDDVWAVGGAMLEYSGATVIHRGASGWREVMTGSILALRAVTGIPGRVLVAGVSGTILVNE
jgi:hypothetical protein